MKFDTLPYITMANGVAMVPLTEYRDLLAAYRQLRDEHARCHYMSQLPHAVSPREHEVTCRHETPIQS